MFERVALFLAKAITKSTKNKVDDNIYDLIKGQIKGDSNLKKKAIKNLIKDGADFVEDELEDLLKVK
jgi:hypothetical protein